MTEGSRTRVVVGVAAVIALVTPVSCGCRGGVASPEQAEGVVARSKGDGGK